MRLNEIYPAHQGEGPRLGTPSVFFRLHHCPVECAWCDTAFTWNGTEKGVAIDVPGALARIGEIATTERARHVVVTGGEPTVAKDLPDLLAGLVAAGYTVEVETAAVLAPSPRYQRPPDWMAFEGVTFNLSPKMPSAQPKMKPDPAVLTAWLTLPLPSLLKIVVADDADWQAMERLLDALPADARDRTWLMPCGVTRAELADRQAWLLDRAAGTGYRVTTRMHVIAFDDRRGT